MTVQQVKILLIQKGLTISEMAQTLIHESLVESSNLDSVRTMLTALLYGHNFYPTLAKTVDTRFGIKIKRPRHLEPVKKALKQVA